MEMLKIFKGLQILSSTLTTAPRYREDKVFLNVPEGD